MPVSNPVVYTTKKASSGYGLAMLMVFLVSTVLIGASLQMVAAPVSLVYLGSSSQDSLSAQELAKIGMETVLNDIQTKRNNNQTVDTSYTYPTTSVTIPNDPASLGGSTTTLGSYSATMTAARGDAFLVKVTAIVGSSSYSLSQLIPINRNSYLLDTISGTSAAYSLRKLRSAYSGSAIRVVRPSDSVEQDIGFAPNGDLDVDSLKTFLGNTTPPLDTVTGAAAAYSLRKLRSAYTGSAIRVRRSSDSTEQDIGFTSGGDLDSTSLLDFVGTGSGYIKTWYDQSGNGKDVSQTTTSKQPRTVNAGILETMNNRPAVRFISTSSTTLTTTSTPLAAGDDTYTYVTLWSTTQNTSDEVIVEQNASTVQNNKRSALCSTGWGGSQTIGFSGQNNDTSGFSFSTNTPYYTLVTVDDSQANNVLQYYNGMIGTRSTSSQGSLAIGNSGFSIGSKYSSASEFFDGYINEVIVYDSVLSTNNNNALKRGLNYYFSMKEYAWGYIKTWYDQSGNGYDVSQSTTSQQPYISTRNIYGTGGRPTIQFKGAQTLNRSTGMVTSADYSKSAVISFVTNAGSDQDFFSGNGVDSFYIDSSNYLNLYHNGTFVSSGTALTQNTLYSILATFVHSSRLGTLYKTNTSVGTGTASTTNTDATIYVGSYGNGYYFTGTISEEIIFSKVLSSSERTILYNDQQSYFGVL